MVTPSWRKSILTVGNVRLLILIADLALVGGLIWLGWRALG